MSSQIWFINTRSGKHQGASTAECIKDRVEVVPLDFSKLREQLEYAWNFDRLVVAGSDAVQPRRQRGSHSATVQINSTPRRMGIG